MKHVYDYLDEKNLKKVKACPKVIIDGIVYYDTSQGYFETELMYLCYRNLVKLKRGQLWLVQVLEK